MNIEILMKPAGSELHRHKVADHFNPGRQWLLISSILIIMLIASCENSSTVKNSDANLISLNQFDPCDNPDAEITCCFANMADTLSNVMNIAKPNEPGEPLLIRGIVFQTDGKTPYADVIIYAYHTDHTGHYAKKGNEMGIQKWHGHLHGWCKTDRNGQYEIHSIRPSPYPDNTIPAHIHAAVREPDGTEPYYITDFVFKDDSLVDENYIASLMGAGGTGVVNLTKKANETWIGQRDIVL
jgi:protocatechuate 3,4-dioxygenase beta subunit